MTEFPVIPIHQQENVIRQLQQANESYESIIDQILDVVAKAGGLDECFSTSEQRKQAKVVLRRMMELGMMTSGIGEQLRAAIVDNQRDVFEKVCEREPSLKDALPSSWDMWIF